LYPDRGAPSTHTLTPLDTRAMAQPRRVIATAVFCLLVLLATLLVQGLWSALLGVNLEIAPALPWAVVVMAIVLWGIWEYSGGRGGPASTQDERRRYRRAGALPSGVFARALVAGSLGLGALILLWLILFQLVDVPAGRRIDVGAYPALTVGAAFVMASAVGSVVEELGLRGYMLTRLEGAVGGPLAIIVVSLLISPGHALTQGFAWPVLLWYFAADVLLGTLSYLSGSIRPGLIVHAIGLLIFFTLIWPADPARSVVAIGDVGASFWLEVAGCIGLAALSVVALRGLWYRARLVT
jgi:membrane protease YdiL (CAAX protease family)